MPLDHYVTLGRSGLRVSPLCLGAMTFGEDLGWGSNVEESEQIMDRLLSGKYSRTSAPPKEGRSAFIGHLLNERTFALVDELDKIAKAHETTVARVALAWLQLQPGVTSTIIGARRMSQLEDNVKALDVTISAEELANLDKKTKPTFGFPANMQPMFPAIHNGGTTVNGVHAEPSSFGILRGEKPY